MSNLIEIKAAVAAYFDKSVADLTVNGQDLFLLTANEVRTFAELHHDFEFSRRLVTVSVSGLTGGSILNAVVYGTSTQVQLKSILEIGLFDTNHNLRPVRWNTVSSALRSSLNRYPIPRYPSDAEALTLNGLSQITISGDKIYLFPLAQAGETQTYTVGMEVYIFDNDWTTLASLSGDPSTTLYSSGTLTPDISGSFSLVGTTAYNSEAVYRHNTLDYYLWKNASNDFRITSAIGASMGAYWTGTALIGTFTAAGTAAGTLTMAVVAVEPTPWLTRGYQYLQWGTIVQLNHSFKEFVFRQEGNLPPPEKLRDEGLEVFKQWDSFRYEQFRRRD